LIVFDASALVSAALKADSVPERALLRAEEVDVFALSAAVDAEIASVLGRSRFALTISLARRQRILEILRRAAVWVEPAVRVTDCRDPKDDKYLELALAAGACVPRTISPLPDPEFLRIVGRSASACRHRTRFLQWLTGHP
jgi:predicted nucleic acid-binding protein